MRTFSSNLLLFAYIYLMYNSSSANKEQRSKNPKIGRPVKTEQGLEFKKQYLANQLKFQLECELIACVHENFFVEPPPNPANKRVSIDYLTALFEKYNAIQVYEILLGINQFYYKNSSVFPVDKLRYTSLIDIAYMFRQLKLKLGPKIRGIHLILAVIFFLYNEKLVNHKFYAYISSVLDKMNQVIFLQKWKDKQMHKIELLIINLILEIAVKQQLKICK